MLLVQRRRLLCTARACAAHVFLFEPVNDARYDTVDVTADVDSASNSLTLALQCFHSNATAAAVMLQLHFHFRDGTSVVAGGTDTAWSAFDAEAVYNAYGAAEVSLAVARVGVFAAANVL
jgi:hypothetical protein